MSMASVMGPAALADFVAGAGEALVFIERIVKGESREKGIGHERRGTEGKGTRERNAREAMRCR
jgi:hypothetical protein